MRFFTLATAAILGCATCPTHADELAQEQIHNEEAAQMTGEELAVLELEDDESDEALLLQKQVAGTKKNEGGCGCGKPKK